MLQKLINLSVDFIKVVGSLVTGFTALFYAAGFLAWNSRMVYLGMPESEIVDINYLITGSSFFVSLPFRTVIGLWFLGWGWSILLVVAFVCGALVFIREYNRNFGKWAFLATGIILSALLVMPLMSGGAFFRYIADPSEQGALFSSEITPEEEIENNYSKLVTFTILALIGVGLMLSWQRKTTEAINLSGAKSSSGGSEQENATTQVGSSWFARSFGLGKMTPWEIASNFITLLIAFIALLYIPLLPMNFIHPVFTERYPVVNVRFSQQGICQEIQPTLLFKTGGLDSQGDLDNANMSEELRRKFEESKIPLSDDVTIVVEEKGSKWLIVDEEVYDVRRQKDRLNVYKPTELFLLEQEKGGGRNLLLYSRERMRIFQVKQEYIEELSIIKQMAIWD